MIDLDQPAQYRTPPDGTPAGFWRRFRTMRALILAVAVSLLAGGILGGVVTYLRWYQPLAASVEKADQADRSAVAVLLFAEPGLRTATGQRRARIEAQVVVVNAGPEPVDVRAVRVDQPGVTVRSPEKERQVAPGTAVPVDVVVEWTCGVDRPAALAASVSVETADEQVRDVTPVALNGAPWTESCR
ncbi:hypothetical protein [Paractinoplanes rishiriensis]|uniref:Uncharacterized protein n=1 Tax=Paractinoplanes rishiriensis TaxID=1050105 RepID=A0A919K4K2_9ACTN|nr:hypothetical protein [Actinoplanes rishiriensis]GIE99434.1 hypothetical protein Ari01nite_68990 [Actinoplanes rishiriensis]